MADNINISIGVMATGVREFVSSALSDLNALKRSANQTTSALEEQSRLLGQGISGLTDPKAKESLIQKKREVDLQIEALNISKKYQSIIAKVNALSRKGLIDQEEVDALRRVLDMVRQSPGQIKLGEGMFSQKEGGKLISIIERFNAQLERAASLFGGISEKQSNVISKQQEINAVAAAAKPAEAKPSDINALEAERLKIAEKQRLAAEAAAKSIKKEVKQLSEVEQLEKTRLDNIMEERLARAQLVKTAQSLVNSHKGGMANEKARLQINKGIRALELERVFILRKIAEKQREIRETSSIPEKRDKAAEVRHLNNELVNVNKKIQEFSSYTGYKMRMQKADGSTIQALAQKHRQFSDMLGIAIGKIIRYRMAFIGMQRSVQTLKDSERIFRMFQYGLSEVRRVMLPLDSSMKDLEKSAIGFATHFGVELMDTLDVMKIWAQQGKSSADIQKLTRTTLVAMVAAGLDANQAVEALTSANKQYNISADESLSVVDKLLFVQARHAVTTQDLADAIKVLGTTAKNVGVSLDSLLGNITAVSSVTRKSGKETANSLKTIFARFVRPDAIKQLNLVGISTMKNKNEMRGLTDVLGDIRSKWDSLTQIQKLNIALMVGGVRRYNDFLVLMDNYDEALVAAAESATATGYSQRALGIDMDTLQRQMLVATQKAKVFGVELGRVATQPFSKLIIGMSEFLEKNGEVNTGLAKNIGWVLKWGTALGAIATSSWLVTLLFGGLSKGILGVALAFGARSFYTFPRILMFIAQALGLVSGATSYAAATSAKKSLIDNKLSMSQWTVSTTADRAAVSVGRLAAAQAFGVRMAKALWTSNLILSGIMALIGILAFRSIKNQYQKSKADMQAKKGLDETVTSAYKAADAEANLLKRREELLNEMEYLTKEVGKYEEKTYRSVRMQAMLIHISRQYGKVLGNNTFVIYGAGKAAENMLSVERKLVEEKRKHVALLMQQSKAAALTEIKNYEARLEAAEEYLKDTSLQLLWLENRIPQINVVERLTPEDISSGSIEKTVGSFEDFVKDIQNRINADMEASGITTRIEINPDTDLYALKRQYNQAISALAGDTEVDVEALNQELYRISKETLNRIMMDSIALTSEEKNNISNILDELYSLVSSKGAKINDTTFAGLTPENLNKLIEKYNELGGAIIVGFDVFAQSAGRLANAYHAAGEEFNALDATIEEYNKSYKEAIELQGRYLGKQKARENALLEIFRKEQGYVNDIDAVIKKEGEYYKNIKLLEAKREQLRGIQTIYQGISDNLKGPIVVDVELKLKTDISDLESVVKNQTSQLAILYRNKKFAAALGIEDVVTQLESMKNALRGMQVDTGAIEEVENEDELQRAVARTLAELEARLPIIKKMQAQRLIEKKDLADIERQYEVNTSALENQYEAFSFYGESITAEHNKRLKLIDYEYDKNKGILDKKLEQKTINEDIYKTELGILDADKEKNKSIEDSNYSTKQQINMLKKEKELNELIVDFIDKRIDAEGKLAVLGARNVKEKIAIQKNYINQQIQLVSEYGAFEIEQIRKSGKEQEEIDEQVLNKCLEIFKKLAGLRSQKIELDYSGIEQFRQDVIEFVRNFSSNISSALVGLSSKQVELSSELRDIDKDVLEQRNTILETQEEIASAEEALRDARMNNASREEIESQEAELRNLNKQLSYEQDVMGQLEDKQDKLKTGWATISRITKDVLTTVSDMVTESNKAELAKSIQNILGTGEGSAGEKLASVFGDINRELYTNLDTFKTNFKTDLDTFLSSEQVMYGNFLSGLSYTLSNGSGGIYDFSSFMRGADFSKATVPTASEQLAQTPFTPVPAYDLALQDASKKITNKKEWKKVGSLMALEFARVLGTSVGGGTQGAAIGSSVGSMLGMIPGYGAVLGPIGSVLGGLLGGALDKPDKQYIEPVMENTDAVEENTDATYSVTNALIDLRAQLINAPSSFSLPPTARIPSLQSGGYVSKTGMALVHSGETVGAKNIINVNISGNADKNTVDYMIGEFQRYNIIDRRFSNQVNLSKGTRARYL